MKFINREKELESLKRVYISQEANLVIIYGRRRLGKTSLIKEFARDLPHCYFLADRADETSQMRSFANALSIKLEAPLLAKSNFSSWYDIFEGIDQFLPKDKKFVLIIDEFQYLCQMQNAYSSFIQKQWDEHWQNQNIMVILCGSVTSMMYKETLSYSAPLYGRSDIQILMKPLFAKHIRSFFGDVFEGVELLKIYSLAGGVPKYLNLVARYKSFAEAFDKLMLDTASPIYSEAKIILQDEVTSPNICWSLLQYIGEGSTRISELAAKIMLPANQLTRYIDLLRDLHLISREVPVLEKYPHKSKKGIYKIIDPFFKLWFSIIYPYESFIEFGEMQKTKAKDRLNDLLEKHFSYCFEELSRQYTQSNMLVLNCIKVGRQWDRNYEIDVAGVNDKNELSVVGECKWSKNLVGLSVYQELQKKVIDNKLLLDKNCKFLFFSKAGFTDELLDKAKTNRTIDLISVDRLFGKET